MIRNLDIGDEVKINDTIYIVTLPDSEDTEYLYLEPKEFEFN